MEQKYAVLVRSVNTDTGEIEIDDSNKGTQMELMKCVEFWKLRSRFTANERAFLVKENHVFVAAVELKKQYPDYGFLNKFAAEIK